MLNHSKCCKVIRHSNAVAAGTSTITPSAGVDCANAESVEFLILWGTITTGGVQSAEVHTSDDDGSADAYTALLGSNVAVTDAQDNKVTRIEIVKPRERYLKCIVNRATQNAVVDGIIAIVHCPRVAPITNDTTVQGAETHISPAEGTA